MVHPLDQVAMLAWAQGRLSFFKPLGFRECWFLQQKQVDSTNTETRGKDISSMRVRPLTILCPTPFAQEYHEPYILWWWWWNLTLKEISNY